ncbi:DUF4189 domain-containing protein [Comamonas terrigena]|uniref:DUF4189 domain-containing protein n=1 Tax=Comamonas terrigena TaxID=32013 RepID=UPI00289BF434|nr:DUF4189 domain-containing protein [Comamonas terrigena]
MDGPLPVGHGTGHGQRGRLGGLHGGGPVRTQTGRRLGHRRHPGRSRGLRAALAVCAQAHTRCAICYTAAVAVATDSEMLASSISYHSRTEAEREALAGCGEPACEIAATVEAPGLYALFTVHQGEDMVGLYLRHGLTSQEQAITQAQQQCKQRDGLRCTLSRWGAIRGELPGTGTPREIYAVQTDAD